MPKLKRGPKHEGTGEEAGFRQRYVEVPIGSIKPHPANPNHGDVEFIAGSIDANGFYGATIVQESSMRILAGEHRWRALKKKGVATIPVLLRDCDDVEALRILLVDNEAARRGEIDTERVVAVLSTLRSVGEAELAGSGFDLKALERMEKEREQQEEKEPDPHDPDGLGSKYGILVMCDDEKDQEIKFERLLELGVEPEDLRVVAI